MPVAFDGTEVPRFLDPLPCGGIPEFDEGSGYAWRCTTCGAVVGSLAMPSDCLELWQEECEKERIWNKLQTINKGIKQ